MPFNKTLIACAMALVSLCAVPSTGSAITNGEADEGRHPYVGALVSYDNKGMHLICSGTLIAPRVFLTAAHCLLDEPADLSVSFDAFVGAPRLGPDVEVHRGQAHAHPDFVDETGPGDTHDVAVVVLDEPVTDVRPAVLPAARRLDNARLDTGDPLKVVGYGREGYDGKRFFGGGGRRFAFSPFDRLEPFKLHLTQRGDDGGTCRGDSGGPAFLPRSRAVVGIVSDGDPYCLQTGVYYRVDTESALSFIERFL